MPDISIVIPAFNEAGRLPAYLHEIFSYFRNLSLHYEVIIVDDGSRDGLENALSHWREAECGLRVVAHPENLGKGAAVRSGVGVACGELVLIADADGATPICQEEELRAAIARGADVAIGSRRTGAATAHRTYARWIAGAVFAAAVRSMVGLTYRDTQCGFKMLRRPVAQKLFALIRERRYLFDVELLWWADRLGYHVDEVPVKWHDRPGGQVRPIRDGAAMVLGLERLRRRLRAHLAQLEAAQTARTGGRHHRRSSLGSPSRR